MNQAFLYQLDAKSKKEICPACGDKRRTWRRYINTKTGDLLAERYGNQLLFWGPSGLAEPASGAAGLRHGDLLGVGARGVYRQQPQYPRGRSRCVVGGREVARSQPRDFCELCRCGNWR